MNDWKDIYDLFNLKCNYTHSTCRTIAIKIHGYYVVGKKADNNLFTSYLLYLDNTDQHYYEKCIVRRDICIPIIKLMLGHLVPSEANMIILAKMPVATNRYAYNASHNDIDAHAQVDIFKMIVDKKIKISSNVLVNALTEKNMPLSNYLINYANPDTRCLEAACACPDSQHIVNLIIAQKIQVTELAFINAIKQKNEVTINMLLQIDYSPNINCLIEACKIKNEKIINRILLCKITPTRECFDALISSANLGYGKDRQATHAPEIANLIDILILHGYKLTYNDVLNALERGCYINNVTRFNIKFDGKFLEECTKIGYHPYSNLGVKPTMNCLYTECRRVGNLPIIKKLIAQGLKPDVECLKQACDNKTNIQNIKYLVEVQGIEPNLACLKQIAKHIGNTTLTYLLSHFPEQIELDEIIEAEIKNSTKTKATPFIDSSEEAPIIDTKKIIEISNKMKLKAQKKNVIVEEGPEEQELEEPEEIEEPIQEVGSDLESEPEPEQDKEQDKEQDSNSLLELKLKSIFISNDTKDDYDIINVTSDKSKKINKTIKYMVLTDAAKILGLKKASLATFLDARKHILSYISKNHLVNNDRKDLIRLNADLYKLLKLKQPTKKTTAQYIKFDDIDNIACNILKV